MTEQRQDCVVADHVMRITLARPEKKNALTQAMYVAIGEALTRAESDPAVRVVLIDSRRRRVHGRQRHRGLRGDCHWRALTRDADADACLPGGAWREERSPTLPPSPGWLSASASRCSCTVMSPTSPKTRGS